jgi:sphingolipid delta-4 desaturase
MVEKETRLETQGKDYWSYMDEPHASRRQAILAKYHQVKKLYGHDPNMRYAVLCLVALQCTLASYAPHFSCFTFVVMAYVVGGTVVPQFRVSKNATQSIV